MGHRALLGGAVHRGRRTDRVVDAARYAAGFLDRSDDTQKLSAAVLRDERYCVSRCAGWTARGENGVAALLPRGYDRKPHRVMPLGVDLELFHPDRSVGERVRAQLGWSSTDAPVVGFIGRFVEEKGIRTLTAALDRVESDWRAMFVGGGPLEGFIREWSARYGERVRVVTGIPHERVPEYLNAMDLICAPSETAPNWREVFGRMIVEAFACGVPSSRRTAEKFRA